MDRGLELQVVLARAEKCSFCLLMASDVLVSEDVSGKPLEQAEKCGFCLLMASDVRDDVTLGTQNSQGDSSLESDDVTLGTHESTNGTENSIVDRKFDRMNEGIRGPGGAEIDPESRRYAKDEREKKEGDREASRRKSTTLFHKSLHCLKMTKN